MGCTSGTVKCVLNIMNILLVLGGIALITVATLSLDSAPSVYIYYLYIVGGISFISAMLGCCGICNENVCLTTMYATIILISLISQIFGKIYVSDSEAIKKYAIDDVEKTWLQEIKVPGSMNKVQQTYHCCGKTGPQNYLEIGRPSYPESCYPNMVRNQTVLYTTGCIEAAETEFLKIFNYSSTSEWTSLVITVVMFLFAVYLVWHFNNKHRRYNY